MAKLIGTAGHVDHGKTTLIRALTGIDADRLPEEKRRGMTIDIGFAYFDLPEIGRVSIVDVPGHEKFVTNMLVGALGVDVALLCVAADEGVKPQTREHLEILDLLPVERMVVALTRADLADQETRELAQLDVQELLETTRFRGAPTVLVSAVTGEGVPELRHTLSEALRSGETDDERKSPWYLPIDRVFAVKGHGTVVTGTLAQGEVKVGDVAVIEPAHEEARVRSIHSHETPLEKGEPGRRIALNLGGIKVEDLHRGQAVGAPGALFETRMLDANMRWITPPKHGQRVRVSIGSEEAIGKAFLSDKQPDVVQLRLESPVACALNQPLIIRRYSPPDVLGGGRVVVPQARPRRKSEAAQAVRSSESEADAILAVLGDSADGILTEEICRLLGRTPQQLGSVFEALSKEGKVVGLGGLWFSKSGFAAGSSRFLEALESLHDKNPTLAAIPREKVVEAAKLKWSGKPLDRIVAGLASEGKLESSGTAVKLPSFRVQLSPKQQAFLERVSAELDKAGVNTPGPSDLARNLSVPPQAVEEILKLGIQAGEIVRVYEGIFYTRRQLEQIKAKLREIAGGKPFAAAAFRDAIGTTRKYAIPLLEYFDATGFTMRLGDERVIR